MNVLSEKTGDSIIYYTYDVNGELISMNYLGNEYFYVKNIQGDILEIVNQSGITVAKCRYDAWGNIIYQYDDGSNLSNINPYRYRGYRYDKETGLYYLNSRYYDPSIGRFISADSISYLDPGSTSGLNLYAYCNNNPVMYLDFGGNMPEWMKWTIGVTVIVGSFVAAVATGGASLAVGTFVGSLVGGGVGLIGGFSFDENGFHFDSNKASTGFMLGSITGAISGSIGAKISPMSKLGTFGQRTIMAGVDGTLSLGGYLGQTVIHREKISLCGVLISFGSGLFSFAEPTGYKILDSIWGPMMGAEIAWAYDMLSGMNKRSNVAALRFKLYF
ncbi:MAG: RHS repeat-associated core domain-containing protein [Candidatus Phytoplasma sp.]|nr:RHS repeat-associated core domain-containing protein [Phytoplasma sp.]